MIKKAVITAAGLATRMFPATKELPKAMLPLFDVKKSGEIILKPAIQIIFERLYGYGIRNYCFVVNNANNILQKHMSPNVLSEKIIALEKTKIMKQELKLFCHMLAKSKITFLKQKRAKGFGDAVLSSQKFVKNDNFILHTDDDLVISNLHFARLNKCLDYHMADAGLLVSSVEDPRRYGVIKTLQDYNHPRDYMRVSGIKEKPKYPSSNLAVVGIYSFTPIIFDYIQRHKSSRNKAIQLTEAISDMIGDGLKVIATPVKASEIRFDIGNTDDYANSFLQSSKF